MIESTVRDYLDSVTPAKRRRDAEVLVLLMARSTGVEPRVSGSIVGFGEYRYRYVSGREGTAFAASFAARKSAVRIYLPDGSSRHADLLSQLGPHKTGVGCLYINDLESIDLTVLETIITQSYETVTADIFTPDTVTPDTVTPDTSMPTP